MRTATENLLAILQDANISSYVFEEPFEKAELFDQGLRLLLLPDSGERYDPVLQRVKRLKGSCLYHLKDSFRSNYAIMKLPDEDHDRWLSVGPILTELPSDEQLLSIIDRMSLSHLLFEDLKAYYVKLPVIADPEVFDIICFGVADTVFHHREHYTLEVIHNSSESGVLQQMASDTASRQGEAPGQRYQKVEKRYELENAFLAAVKTGSSNDALSAYYSFYRFLNESELTRMPDRLRDLKDLGITLNSLLRKAAEDAGVHPYYIDSFSNRNVTGLEQCTSRAQVDSFYRELITGYCGLVKEYGLNHYSRPVQDAIILIQTDMTADVSLAAIADKLDLNHSYLSTLFRKETGQSISGYVLERRIQRAQHLLSTTPLSIQDIAWEVGIPDANYFARLFRRETGHTPRSYREHNRNKGPAHR